MGYMMVTRPGKLLHMENHHAINGYKLTISMAIFNSYVKLPEGKLHLEKMGLKMV